MKPVFWLLAILSAIAASAPSLAETAPEITRAPAPAQATGARHVTRAIPEACVLLAGMFSADGKPYTLSAAPRQRCQARAKFVGIDVQDDEPGWILNDRISVPRADRAECVATIRVWRHPGKLAAATRDAQQRVRMYLDTDAAPVQRPRYRASLEISAACSN